MLIKKCENRNTEAGRVVTLVVVVVVVGAGSRGGAVATKKHVRQLRFNARCRVKMKEKVSLQDARVNAGVVVKRVLIKVLHGSAKHRYKYQSERNEKRRRHYGHHTLPSS